MYNKKRSKHSKRMIWLTIVLVAVSVVALLTNTSGLPFSSVLKDTVANVEYYTIKAPISYVSNVFKEYNDLKLVYRENKKLKKSLDNYARELALNDVLSKELEELKNITGIDSLTTDYKVKYTTVIERDSENWDNQVTIDLGSASKVKKGMAVITSQGMIGTITKVNAVSSTVTLLTSEKNSAQLPVMIISNNKTYYGLLDSYSVSKKAYKIMLLSTTDSIVKGSKVTTSGLGGSGKSPKGILVGTVTGFSSGNNATGKSVTVKPSADFDSLNYVAVVQRVK